MVIQVIGIVKYFIANILSSEKALFYVAWLNINGIAFMPDSMFTGYISNYVFSQGQVAPYPIDPLHIVMFLFVYFIVFIISYLILKKRMK